MKRTWYGKWKVAEPVWDRERFLRLVRAMNPQASFLKVGGTIRPADFVIRYENLLQDFDAFSAALSLPCTAKELPHLNQSADEGGLRKRAYEDADLRAIVADRFAEDFELFGYASR